MNPVPLTLAISDYDHVRDLVTGRVGAQGIALTCLDLSIEEIFYRFTRHREWDVSEMSLAKYVALIAGGDDSLAAIPVFPSRVFRQSAIFVRAESGIVEPRQLVGRRVGIPEWAQTAGVYVRGWLNHQMGVDLASIDWVQAGVNEPGRIEKVALGLPRGVRVRAAPDHSLDALLRAGEIDAAITAHPPACFENGHHAVRRLYPEYRAIEEEYFRATRVFPIMHVVAIKRACLAGREWIAGNLLTAFEEAKRRAILRTREVTAPRVPIPWCFEAAEKARALFGEDPWPYGLEANRATLTAFLGFAREQGVCARPLAPEDLFLPSTLGKFKV